MSLSLKIVIALVGGAVFGVALYWMQDAGFFVELIEETIVGGVFETIGKLFINGLKMMIVPLVFISLVCGVTSSDDTSRLGPMGAKSFFLYLCTTGVAITLALAVSSTLNIGVGADMEGGEFVAKDAPSIQETIIGLVPKNLFEAFAAGNMLQIIVFAILFGLAMNRCGDLGRRVINQFRDLNEINMKLIEIILNLAPYGVFCLVGKVFAENGPDLFESFATYMLTVIGVLILHTLGTFGLMLSFLARVNVLAFLRKMWPVQMFAFSTASSAATMPFTLETVEDKLGVHNSVASFTVPLGTTINMDGTAIMQGVATVFIANAYGFDLSMADYLVVILTATLASIGTAAVPSAGLVTLSMVLVQIGLPTEAVGVLLGVDRILDMVRTAVNVTGDATIACVLAKSEKRIDMDTFNSFEQSDSISHHDAVREKL